MRAATFFAAGLIVGLAFQALKAQKPDTGVEMMNHLGINVANLDEAITYYT
jgi:hypothetical protein